MNKRILGLFTLRSPLSHIKEVISTFTYLAEESLVQPDGSIEEVFCYSGNAWRGQLRDLAAIYTLERLGAPQLPLQSFHLLFSGGNLYQHEVNINRAREYRRSIPILSLFGGSLSDRILPGKLRVSNAYPLCAEAIVALPPSLHEIAMVRRYREMTMEKVFNRTDDAKNPRFEAFLSGVSDGADEDKKSKDNPQQMLYHAEALAAGAQLYSEIDLLDVNEVELGVLVAALHMFSRSPHIGGLARVGFGRVELEYDIMDLDTGAREPFIRIGDDSLMVSPLAGESQQSYDQYLRAQYDAFLESHGSEMLSLLGVGA